MIRIGAADRTVHPYYTRRMFRLLRQQRTNVTYSEIADKEHWWWDTYKTNDGGVVNDPVIRNFAVSHAQNAAKLSASKAIFCQSYYRYYYNSLSLKTVNTRENFWNVYCFATNQMRDETAKDNRQIAAWISHNLTWNNKLEMEMQNQMDFIIITPPQHDFYVPFSQSESNFLSTKMPGILTSHFS